MTLTIDTEFKIQYDYDYDMHPMPNLNAKRHKGGYAFLSRFMFSSLESLPKLFIYHHYKPYELKQHVKQKIDNQRYFSYWNDQFQDNNKAVYIEDLENKRVLVKERQMKHKPLIDFNADFIPFKQRNEFHIEGMKCSYCNLNHNLTKCNQYKRRKPICDSCREIRHTSNECLKYPSDFNDDVKESNSNRICLKCGLRGHLYCSTTNRIVKSIFTMIQYDQSEDDNDNNDMICEINNSGTNESNRQTNTQTVYQPQPSVLLLNKHFYDEDDDLSI